MYEGKTQEEMVAMCLHRYDMNFAGRNQTDLDILYKLREDLLIAPAPDEHVEIRRYIAKGTAGWVFEADWKDGGEKVAMKLIRMTQAVSGVKEWFVSRKLQDLGVDNVVLTDERVFVVTRSNAPQIVETQLKDAGHVEHYLCLMQDFMNGGTLEKLAEEPRFTTQMMLQALEDVAHTLDQMHANKIVHKDVKPENVLVEMHRNKLVAAKLCDFGSCEFGSGAAGRQDDLRRFGVTLFSLATGENWKKNRLIHEKHDRLVARLEDFVEDCSDGDPMKQLPFVLHEIFKGYLHMNQVAKLISDLRKPTSEKNCKRPGQSRLT